jgi:hypothetical protein
MRENVMNKVRSSLLVVLVFIMVDASYSMFIRERGNLKLDLYMNGTTDIVEAKGCLSMSYGES